VLAGTVLPALKSAASPATVTLSILDPSISPPTGCVRPAA